MEDHFSSFASPNDRSPSPSPRPMLKVKLGRPRKGTVAPTACLSEDDKRGRRRAANRESARRMRARRAETVQQLSEKVEKIQSKYEELQFDNQEIRQNWKKTTLENRQLRAQLSSLQASLPGASHPPPPAQAPVPPSTCSSASESSSSGNSNLGSCMEASIMQSSDRSSQPDSGLHEVPQQPPNGFSPGASTVPQLPGGFPGANNASMHMPNGVSGSGNAALSGSGNSASQHYSQGCSGNAARHLHANLSANNAAQQQQQEQQPSSFSGSFAVPQHHSGFSGSFAVPQVPNGFPADAPQLSNDPSGGHAVPQLVDGFSGLGTAPQGGIHRPHAYSSAPSDLSHNQEMMQMLLNEAFARPAPGPSQGGPHLSSRPQNGAASKPRLSAPAPAPAPAPAAPSWSSMRSPFHHAAHLPQLPGEGAEPDTHSHHHRDAADFHRAPARPNDHRASLRHGAPALHPLHALQHRSGHLRTKPEPQTAHDGQAKSSWPSSYATSAHPAPARQDSLLNMLDPRYSSWQEGGADLLLPDFSLDLGSPTLPASFNHLQHESQMQPAHQQHASAPSHARSRTESGGGGGVHPTDTPMHAATAWLADLPGILPDWDPTPAPSSAPHASIGRLSSLGPAYSFLDDSAFLGTLLPTPPPPPANTPSLFASTLVSAGSSGLQRSGPLRSRLLDVSGDDHHGSGSMSF